MIGRGGGLTILMLLCSIIIIIFSILPSADNTLFIGRYFINWLMPASSSSMSWTSYHRLDSIYSWMDRLSRTYPNKVKIHMIGKTHEGREIRVVRVGKRNRRRRQSGSK